MVYYGVAMNVKPDKIKTYKQIVCNWKMQRLQHDKLMHSR